MNSRSQSLRPLLLTLLGAALLAGAAAVLAQREALTRGALNGLPAPSLPERVPVLGVNVDLTTYDPAGLEENLDLIAQTGFVWVRQSFAWDRIEPQPGIYDWVLYDPLVEAAAARGLRIVAVLERSPAWAADHPTAPPDDPGAFADFAAAAAARYEDTIDVYQIWDEPNLASGWGNRPPDPVAYAALLEAAYQAIHGADPEALVLTAGLAPTVEAGPDNLSDLLYLRRLYENGAAPFFDGVAGKPYGFDTGPEDRRVHPNLLNFSRFILLRQEMEHHGDGHKPLWASHFGWNSLPPGWEGGLSLWGQTDPAAQAERTVDAYSRALAEWPWSGALILENWQPAAPEDDPRWGFALRSQEGRLSPLVEALREKAPVFNGALWPGLYPAQTPLAVYSGEWEFSDLGADFSEDGSSVVDVPFAGDTLAVIVRRGDYRAYLYVEVDGQPSTILPRDERGTYLVLTSPDYEPRIEVLPVARGQMGSVRVAHLEAERGWDQWALIGYAVGAQIVTWRHDLLAATLLLVGVGALGSSMWLSRGLRWRAALDRLAGGLASRLGSAVHLALSLAAALAAWIGAALTWGGLIPELVRRLGDTPSLILTALTAGVFYFSPWLVLTIAALIVLFILIYARPTIGIALVMGFTPYYLLPRPLFDRAFSMVEVISLLTLLAWAIRVTADRHERGWPSLAHIWHSMTGLDRALSLFLGAALLSLTWADLPGVAVTDLRQMVIEPMVMYLVLRTLPASACERWQILDLLVLTGVVVSLIGYYQAVTGIDVITAEAGTRRLRSIFATPNNAALFLGRVIPIAAAVLLVGGERRRRAAYGAAALLMLGAEVLTLSRGGLLLGLPAGIGLILVLWLGRLGAVLVAAGAGALGLALIPLSRLPRFANLFDLSEGSSFFRLQLWNSTFQMLRDHPFTGVGLDQFLYQYRGRYILPAAWQQPDLSQPHNFLLNYWVRLGLIGLAAGVWIQIAFWRIGLAAHKRLKAAGDQASRGLVIGLLGSMAAFIGHGLVDETHFVIDLAFIFYMTLGMMHQIGMEAANGSGDPG